MISDDDLLPVVRDEAHTLPSPELVRKARRAADLARAPALPTTAAVLATYLADLHHQGRAVASLAVARAAVLFINKEAGHGIDGKAEAIRKVMAGARRTRRADPKRVRPFLISDFLELAPHMGDGLEDVRDRAMLALGLARALRGPSELMTLDLDRLGSPDARGFIELGARGITVHLVRSKTSQEVTKSYFIERGPAVEAVEAWIRRAGITAGTPLWRTVQGKTPDWGNVPS